jgi:hypothetical protein
MHHDDLLQEFQRLSYSERVQRMVDLGRRARSDTEAAAVLTSLEHGGFYERWLALQACYGSRDGASILRALSDPSQAIRSTALGLVALICDDAQVHNALDMLLPQQQRRLLMLLARRRRHAPIDAFLLRVDDTSLPQCLPYGSAPMVAQHVERVCAGAGYEDWRRLAVRHPSAAAMALQQQARTASSFDQRLLWQANAVLPLLAERVPDQALALVQALLPHISVSQLNLQALAQRRPEAVVDLLLQSGDQVRIDLTGLVRRLDAARLQSLVARGLLGSPRTWLPRLAPALRRTVYEVAALGWRDTAGVLPLAVVATLPSDLRILEARRHLALPTLATRPAQRLPYAACLPWDEARTTLETFIRNPDPELRVVALPALIGAARYERERLAEALQIVLDRRHEQDPVRQAMLQAVAELPPGRWEPVHLPVLSQIVRAALDAADCSQATAATAERLVIALLPFHPDWSTQTLAILGRERGWLSSYTLEQRLSDVDVQRIAPALLPVLQAWQPRERDNAIFRAAAMFGRRLRAFPALLDILEQYTGDSRAWVASQALHQMARYHRTRLPARIPALLREDPSWITQPIVYTYLHRWRQDLLTPFLGQTAYSGRFSTGKTRFVLPLCNGFYRWTPEQQSIFAAVLEDVIHDEQRDSPALFMAINQLAALPALDPTPLVQLADLHATRLAARDVALRALGRLDAGQGIPTLLGALDDDRARIAIYALRRALLQMPATQALALLRGVPSRRVTVAKEVVRLLGELPGGVAYTDLLAMAGADLHRDVRVALLRALWDHLEQPETWPLLEQAATSDDAAIAAGVIRIPADRRSPEVLRRLARLLATLLGHPAPQVRLDTLQRCATLPLSDPDRVLLPPLFQACNSPLPDERTTAARAVFATYAGRDAGLVGDAVRQLLPNRRALVTMVRALQAILPWYRGHMLPTARAVLTVLARDPLTAVLQVEVAVSALLWNETLDLLRYWAATDVLHADIVTAAVSAIQASAHRADPADLAAVETRLRGEADPRLRRIALATLVALTQSPRGWDAERLARLQAYRADPAPLVAAAAQFILPPDEVA